jgi:hypothetical protein
MYIELLLEHQRLNTTTKKTWTLIPISTGVLTSSRNHTLLSSLTKIDFRYHLDINLFCSPANSQLRHTERALLNTGVVAPSTPAKTALENQHQK